MNMVTLPKEPCCEHWKHAHEIGTDNEEYSVLVWYDEDDKGRAAIGSDLPPVRFCPWCGAVKQDLTTAENQNYDSPAQ